MLCVVVGSLKEISGVIGIMSMNKFEVGLAVAVVGVLLFVGDLVYFEMATTLENNPDIEVIGPPGLQPPRLEYLVAMLIVTTIAIGIILKLNPDDKKEVK